MWSPRHQHWLSSELRLDAKQRTCALRTPHIPLPQWLKTLAMRGAPSDFTSQRAKLHAYGF